MLHKAGISPPAATAVTGRSQLLCGEHVGDRHLSHIHSVDCSSAVKGDSAEQKSSMSSVKFMNRQNESQKQNQIKSCLWAGVGGGGKGGIWRGAVGGQG